MSAKKNSPKGQGKNKKEILTEKAMSFHGRLPEDIAGKLIRPRTVPNLVAGGGGGAVTTPKLTKLLLNVTVQRSLGPVQVLISPESSVGDLIAAALRQYFKEGRRPVFPSLDPSRFDLHYSQFSLESLDRDEKVNELGSRNFFLCPKQVATTTGTAGSSGGGHGEIGISYGGMITSPPCSSACSKEAEKVTEGGVGWLGFMEFML